MTLVGVCDDCGYADGGHAPSCPRWQTTSEYERLKAQKEAIIAKEKARGDALMKQLEGTLMGKLRETEAERDALTARLATLEQLNRDLARALVNEDADAVLPPAHQAVADLLYSAWSYARNPQQFNLEVLAEAARAYGATVKP